MSATEEKAAKVLRTCQRDLAKSDCARRVGARRLSDGASFGASDASGGTTRSSRTKHEAKRTPPPLLGSWAAKTGATDTLLWRS